ncbi:hypothetical protein LX36DRAFT_397974 [Colletotrichum falcatum]|nr:hypothetical protein LX36DRAFT_397974 [Colletotrichum falcatum]
MASGVLFSSLIGFFPSSERLCVLQTLLHCFFGQVSTQGTTKRCQLYPMSCRQPALGRPACGTRGVKWSEKGTVHCMNRNLGWAWFWYNQPGSGPARCRCRLRLDLGWAEAVVMVVSCCLLHAQQ